MEKDMEENKNLNAEEQEPWIITLTDEETGENLDFEVVAEGTVDDKNYFALVPVNDDGEEYVILEYKEDGDEVLLETIEDDEVFEKVEDYFNDLLFSEVDYDEE
jgi:hypothetical protein